MFCSEQNFQKRKYINWSVLLLLKKIKYMKSMYYNIYVHMWTCALEKDWEWNFFWRDTTHGNKQKKMKKNNFSCIFFLFIFHFSWWQHQQHNKDTYTSIHPRDGEEEWCKKWLTKNIHFTDFARQSKKNVFLTDWISFLLRLVFHIISWNGTRQVI